MTRMQVKQDHARRHHHRAAQIDTSRSAVTFRTRHLFGLAPARGSFKIRDGTVDVAEPLAGSRIYAEIETASLTPAIRSGMPACGRRACWMPAATR